MDQQLPTTTLSSEQLDAANKALLWHRNKSKPYFFLSGYAGTGKTFLIEHLIRDHLKLTYPSVAQYREAEKAYRNAPTADPNDLSTFVKPPSYPTAFAAFTAKASMVMQSKKIPASTIHSLLYAPIIDYGLIQDLEIQLNAFRKVAPLNYRVIPEYQELFAKLKEASKPTFSFVPPDHPKSRLRNTKLLVLDECSMIGTELWNDLLATRIPILIIGDMGQLPPVKSAAAPFALNPPDAQLNEIVRQSWDSPIIQFATKARKHMLIQHVRVLSPSHTPKRPQLATRIPLKTFMATHLTKNDMLWFDQILCATHRRRQWINRTVRTFMFDCKAESLPTFPQIGEKIVCGENDHDKQIYNGVIYKVTDIDQQSYADAMDSYITSINPVASPMTFNAVEADMRKADPFGHSAYQEPKPPKIRFELTDDDSGISAWVETGIDTFLDYNDAQAIPSNDFAFDFGYAITVHKAQGSQWPKVLMFNEKMHFSQSNEDYARWLYTAITRASDCIVLAG